MLRPHRGQCRTFVPLIGIYSFEEIFFNFRAQSPAGPHLFRAFAPNRAQSSAMKTRREIVAIRTLDQAGPDFRNADDPDQRGAELFNFGRRHAR